MNIRYHMGFYFLVMHLFVKTKLTLFEQLQTIYQILYGALSNNHSIIFSCLYRMYADELWTIMLVHHRTHQTIKLVCDAIESKLYIICPSIE